MVGGCKHDKDKEGQSAATSQTTSGTTTTQAANTTTQETKPEETKPPKPATSGCAWPDKGDHDITITKGCEVVAKDHLTLTDGATMTIEEGAKISFDTDGLLEIDYGKLVVKGTAAAPVTFTSSNKSPGAGDWVGIHFREKTMQGSSIDHAIIDYAGSPHYSGEAALRIDPMRQKGRVAITNTTIRNSQQFGLRAEDNGTFASFENNTFKDNKKGSMQVVAEVLGSVGKGNKFNDPIHVLESKVEDNVTWPAFDVPVFLDDTIKITNASSLPVFTIADKTTLKCAKDVRILVGEDGAGSFVAKNVTFTSASPAPSPGDWDGVVLFAKSNGTDIEGSTFEYFGQGSYSTDGAITVKGNAKDLNNVTIKNNTFRKGKLQAMHSDDGKCAPFDTQNKAEGVPFCNKP